MNAKHRQPRIVVSLPARMRERLRELAREDGRSEAEYVRSLIGLALAEADSLARWLGSSSAPRQPRG